MPAGEVDGVRVDVGSGQGTYPVLVRPGLLDDLPGLLSEHAPARRYAIISDDRVASLYGEVAVERCRAQGLEADLLTFETALRIAFADLLLAQERTQALETALSELNGLVDVLRVREELGEGSRFDRLRAEREVAEIDMECAGEKE